MLWSNCGCCGCDPTTTKIRATVTDFCTSTAVSGVTVTVKDGGGATIGTCTTDASGQCTVGITKLQTYTVTFAKSGYCDASTTVNATNCGAIFAANASIKPTTIPATFTPSLCCTSGPCPPSASHPVTVTVTQTVGGTFTDSCTATDSSGCTINLPIDCNADTVFSISWSATGFDTATSTLTIPHSPFLCSVSASKVLMVPNTDFCFPADDCLAAFPTTLTVTLSSPPSGCPASITVSYDSASSSPGCLWSYTGTASCSIGGETATVKITKTSAGVCSATGVVIGPNLHTYNLTSGTAACPVAFSAASNFGETATVAE